MLQKDKLNIIKAPTGSGKTYFALNAIPNAVDDAYHKTVYLIDTINGKEQILNNYNASVYSSYWMEEVSDAEIDRFYSSKIVVITYATATKEPLSIESLLEGCSEAELRELILKARNTSSNLT